MALDVVRNMDLMISQWDGAVRLRALLRGVLEVAQAELVEPAEALQRGQVSLSGAQGVWLDRIATRLGALRPRDFVGEMPFGFSQNRAVSGRQQSGTGFNQGYFFSIGDPGVRAAPLADNVYRGMVQARGLKIRTSPSLALISEQMDIIFGEGDITDNAQGGQADRTDFADGNRREQARFSRGLHEPGGVRVVDV